MTASIFHVSEACSQNLVGEERKILSASLFCNVPHASNRLYNVIVATVLETEKRVWDKNYKFLEFWRKSGLPFRPRNELADDTDIRTGFVPEKAVW